MKRKLKRRPMKIGRTPIPRMTCKVCGKQYPWDEIEIHWQAAHYEEYENAYDIIMYYQKHPQEIDIHG